MPEPFRLGACCRKEFQPKLAAELSDKSERFRSYAFFIGRSLAFARMPGSHTGCPTKAVIQRGSNDYAQDISFATSSAQPPSNTA